MKPWVTYTVGSIAIAAMLAGGILLLRYKRSRTASYACTSLEISFCEPYRFISEEEVDELLVEKMLPYVGQRMDGIDINGYERALRLNPSDSDVLHNLQFLPKLHFSYRMLHLILF